MHNQAARCFALIRRPNYALCIMNYVLKNYELCIKR